MFGFKDSHIRLMWVLVIAFIFFGILPMLVFAINPDKQSLLHNNIFTDKPDPSSIAHAAEPATPRNPDTGTIKSFQNDNQPGTSFQIDWYKDGAVKYTSTVHYGYIDSYGRYHQDSLPAAQTDKISKDCVSNSIITSGDSNIAYGTYSSFFDIDQYSQTINYNGKYYSLYGCYFGNTPNQPTAFKLSKMTFRYDNSSDGEFYYINKWYNDGDYFYQENSTNPKWASSTPASNKDIYIAFKEQTKDSSGKLDAENNGFKAHWQWSDGDGAQEKVLQFRYAHKVWNSSTSAWEDELLPSQFAGDVYIATFNSMPDTSSGLSYSNKKFVNIYDYVGKFINYAGQNYVYDYTQCCDTGNPKMEGMGTLEAIGYQPSWTGTQYKWCWGTRDLSNNYRQGWTWNRGDGWKDWESYFRTTIYFNDTNSWQDLYSRNKPTRGNQIVNNTVDSAADGVDLKIFDYDAWNDSADSYKRYTNTGINKNSVFKFSKGTFSNNQDGSGTQGGVQYWFNQYDYIKYGWAVHDIFGKLFDYENNNPVLKNRIYDGKPNGTDLYDDLTSVDETKKDMTRFFNTTDTFNGHKKIFVI